MKFNPNILLAWLQRKVTKKGTISKIILVPSQGMSSFKGKKKSKSYGKETTPSQSKKTCDNQGAYPRAYSTDYS